ncbi:hypothetical protein RUM44_013128 [Polyplax serrata]|uniref:Uncharacterized protein n=1 Tax=Polyplax serrata TaxID=468196 RepID=A0ABR1BH19_POLSC
MSLYRRDSPGKCRKELGSEGTTNDTKSGEWESGGNVKSCGHGLEWSKKRKGKLTSWFSIECHNAEVKRKLTALSFSKTQTLSFLKLSPQKFQLFDSIRFHLFRLAVKSFPFSESRNSPYFPEDRCASMNLHVHVMRKVALEKVILSNSYHLYSEGEYSRVHFSL